MRKILVALLMICSVYVFPQTSRNGYFVTKDGKRYNNVTIKNPDYADSYERVFIQSEQLGIDSYLYPKDIAFYGTDFGYKYISTSLKTDTVEKQVFIKELIRDGEINLYKYEDLHGVQYYTIDRQSGKYTPIVDGGAGFRALLQERAKDCDVLDGLNAQKLKMTDSSLLSLYESYTNCSLNNYPGIRWGVTVNAGYSFFNFDDEIRFDIPDRPYAMPGLFVDIPIDRRISFRPEIYYFYTATKTKSVNQVTGKNDFSYYRHSLVVPLMLRYRFSNVKGNTIPYIEMGATFDIMLSGKISRVEVLDTRIDNLSQTGSYLNVGPEFGAGIEHTLASDRILYAGLRGAYYFSAVSSDKKEHRSNISVNVGISF